MAITLTDSAAQRVREFMQREQASGLRLDLRKSGCSGWAYEVELVDQPVPGDVVFEQGDVKVFVNSEVLEKIDGTEIDFVQEGINRVFKFNNPNVTASCGCGESISFD